VKDTDIAYHAGESQWVVDGKTRKYINNYSIGIELEGDGNLVEYTDFQYDTLIELVKTLKDKYKITENNIVGHEDIAPTRKVDPGKFFDWMHLRKGISPSVITAPVAAPTVPPVIEKLPDEQFFMRGGTNKDGRRPGWFASLLKILLGLFSKS
jgi:N-acetyl-anhydromuramyl-L-alanine amidase AmpD